MKRTLLDELLREVERITGDRDLVMIGSQAIHAVVADVPAEVVMSRECDLLFDESDPVAAAIDACLGPSSERAAELLVHVADHGPLDARAAREGRAPRICGTSLGRELGGLRDRRSGRARRAAGQAQAVMTMLLNSAVSETLRFATSRQIVAHENRS